VVTIDLVLIDQQSLGKRCLHLMDTVNAIYWRATNSWKRATWWHALLKSEHNFLILMTSHFWNAWLTSFLFYSVSGNANSTVVTYCRPYMCKPRNINWVLGNIIPVTLARTTYEKVLETSTQAICMAIITIAVQIAGIDVSQHTEWGWIRLSLTLELSIISGALYQRVATYSVRKPVWSWSGSATRANPKSQI
jgi:hypothetical protein